MNIYHTVVAARLESPIKLKILLEKTVSNEEASIVIFDVDSAKCEARGSLNQANLDLRYQKQCSS